MRDLKVGARIVQYVGEANAPYGHDVDEVTADGASNQAGWLWVRSLSMTDEQAAALIAEGAVEDGCDPREGFFSYSLDTLLNRVI